MGFAICGKFTLTNTKNGPHRKGWVIIIQSRPYIVEQLDLWLPNIYIHIYTVQGS